MCAEETDVDIFLDPKTQSDTLGNLGPLRPLAGIWEGRKGIDEHAVADGSARAEYVERIELQPSATEFELAARLGSESFGICSNPFLQRVFRTTEYRIRVTVNVDGTWSYDQDTVLEVLGRSGPFHHRDRNTLSKIADPTPNPRSGASPLDFVSSGSAQR